MFINRINKNGYERKDIVSYYAQSRLQIPEVMLFVKYKEKIRDRHILDIGCGAGRTTPYLKHFSPHYTGIDYSSPMINSCKKRFPHTRFLHCDARNMEVFKDQTFDFILFSFNGLDAIGHEDRLKELREIHRVLKGKGLFVFSSHNRNFQYAQSRPKLSFSLKPCIQMVNILQFITSYYNHLTNKKYQHFYKDYAVINDRAHNYGFLSYYIDKESQAAQLKETGFTLLEMYATSGKVLKCSEDDIHSGWIYYVAVKEK